MFIWVVLSGMKERQDKGQANKTTCYQFPTVQGQLLLSSQHPLKAFWVVLKSRALLAAVGKAFIQVCPVGADASSEQPAKESEKLRVKSRG